MKYGMVVCLLLSGCAFNGIIVEEKSSDGTLLRVEQKTVTTLGAKTEEGEGAFRYTAESENGDNFDMSAGANVVGQDTPDPSKQLLSFAEILKQLGGLMYGYPEVEGSEPPPE